MKRMAGSSGSLRAGREQARVLRVGLLGLGNVGTGVAEILSRHRRLIAERQGVDLKIVRALVRSDGRLRQGAAHKVPLTKRAGDILEAPDIDVVCELLGGLRPAREYIEAALKAGKPVVSANKAVLARYGDKLLRLAAERRLGLYFEAAVAGGLPIIRTLREGLAGDRISRVAGILNGTCNFVLGRMEAGDTYAQALREAQRLGFAEADPSLDVSGGDAADKLAILLQLAFGLTVSPGVIPTEGITHLTPDILADAARLGYRIKLLAIGQRHTARGVDARVHPAMVPVGHPLSTVRGADNAVAVTSDALGTTLYQGAGAGGLATGSAVVADLVEAARDLWAGATARLVRSSGAPSTLLPPTAAKGPYYMRLRVVDRPGVLATITRILGRHRVSLATVLQREHADGAAAPVSVVMTTHTASHAAMNKVVGELSRVPALRGPPVVIRIVEEEHVEHTEET